MNPCSVNFKTLKTMKKSINFALAVIAVAATLSCNKFENTGDFGPSQERCNINVSLAGAVDVLTKAAGVTTDNEKKVNNLQVLVFRGDYLDAYGTASATNVSISCTAGSRTIYAVVNAPDLSGISSKSAFLSTLVDLSSNSLSSLVMVGSDTVTLPGTNSVTISVSRMVARVVLKKITRQFTAAALQNLTFKVDSIYVVNAAGNAPYSLGSAPTKWYNEGGNKNEIPALLVDAPGATIANTDSYTTPHYFYAMPNPATSKTTRLVIAATLGSAKYYYPIDLPALEANKSYEIAGVKIQRADSDDPDTPVSSSSVSFTVTVTDWVTNSISEQVV